MIDMQEVTLPFEEDEIILRPSKILCLVKNFEKHAEEFEEHVPDEIEFFLKPPSSLLPPDSEILIPSFIRIPHHEVELGVIIGKKAKDVPRGKALDHVLGYTVFLDITARDIQAKVRRCGMPWVRSKALDTFAPVGPRVVRRVDMDAEIGLSVNGEMRQRASLSEMVFGVEEVISEISRYMTLYPHDIIAMGTPAGVGKLHHGDEILAWIEGIGELRERVRYIRNRRGKS